VAILQQKHTSLQQPEIVGNTTLIMKTKNKKEMTVSTMQLDKQEKTLTLAIELRQGLALAKLLDIMNLEQKTVRDWPVCQ
jgi:hypothetical protein